VINIGVLAFVVSAVPACGGSDSGEFGTSIRGEAVDPTCGMECPETCWVDIAEDGVDYEGSFFIFDADLLNATALENAEVVLEIPGDLWSKELADDVPAVVPERLDFVHPIGDFDASHSSLTVKVVLGSPVNDAIYCGFALVD
jgi:hypothetical protein